MREIEAADVAQLHPFELLPEPLAWVQLWSIGRQALQMQPLRRTMGEELSDALTAMHRGPVPDDD
jgi:hypothetical protein